MKYFAVIVAGGSGSRLQSDVPKQFLPLNNKPVLLHTIEAFYYSDFKPEIILVLNSGYLEFWKNLCLEHKFKVPHSVVPGGSERFFSVKGALNTIQQDGIVAIHDAVRPVVSNHLITESFRAAEAKGAVIPVVSSRDSLRKKEGDRTVAVDREDILIVQTPQVFRSDVLKTAYQQEFSKAFTDDASVVEKAGFPISTIEGDFKNLKITWQEDLAVAALFLKSKA